VQHRRLARLPGHLAEKSSNACKSLLRFPTDERRRRPRDRCDAAQGEHQRRVAAHRVPLAGLRGLDRAGGAALVNAWSTLNDLPGESRPSPPHAAGE
jgi:hypothetical protein